MRDCLFYYSVKKVECTERGNPSAFLEVEVLRSSMNIQDSQSTLRRGSTSPIQVTPWVRVCDSHGLCADASTSAVGITLPDSLPPEVIGELSTEIRQAFSSDASVEAGMERAAGVLATLAAMGDTDNLAVMQNIIEDEAKNKIASLESNLGSEAAQSAAFGMMSGSLALMAEVDLSVDLLLRVQALNNRLLSQLSGLPLPDSSRDQFMFDSMNTASMSSSPSSKPIYYPETDEDLNAVRNGGTRASASASTRIGRRKRDTEKESKPSYMPMSQKNVRVSIKLAELLIIVVNMTDGAKTAATDKLVNDIQT
ncbi:hypothetical protein FHG87_011152 [Trinorchestia longiramus]|nr:hypothetical protein FHG87_011152 [Trinorchestia longiramus]